MTRSGFWEEFDALKKDCPDADWIFLLNEEKFCDMTPYNFLHGDCVAFAQYLNETYGYEVEIEYEREDDEEDSPAHIVHAYCTTKDSHGDKVYVDVRGANSDWFEFMEEFYVTGLWSDDDYCYEQPYANGIPGDLKEEEGSKTLRAASEIDNKNGFYDIREHKDYEDYEADL